MSGKASVPAAPNYGPLLGALQNVGNTAQGMVPGEMGEAQSGAALEAGNVGQAGQEMGQAGNEAALAGQNQNIASTNENIAGGDYGTASSQQGALGGEFNQNQGVTNQVEGQDLGVQQGNNQFATGLQNQFENQTAPMMGDFASKAQNYGSAQNIEQQMGLAEGTTSQAMDQSRQNATQDLEGFGIDPTATRYAGLDAGLQAQKGAAVAAAGNTARQNTVQTGLGLEQSAIGQGEVLPGMAAGSQNVGLQAGSGASNTGFGQAQSGANTLGTGMQWEGLGNQSMGLGNQAMSNANQSYGVSNQGEGMSNQSMSNANSSLMGSEGGYNLANGSLNAANGAYGAGGQMLNAGYQNQIQGAMLQNQENGQMMGAIGTAAGMFLEKGGAIPDPNNDGDDYGSYKKGPGGPYDPTKWYVFPGHDATGQRMSFNEAATRFMKTGQHHGVASTPDEAWHLGKVALQHNHPYAKAQALACGGAVGYADGGDIDERDGGGVPASASPSHGAVTDDIPGQTDQGQQLRLNAGEFVIPKDAAAWIGHKQLQGMITKAREQKMGASAQPQQKVTSQGKRSALDLGGGI